MSDVEAPWRLQTFCCVVLGYAWNRIDTVNHMGIVACLPNLHTIIHAARAAGAMVHHGSRLEGVAFWHCGCDLMHACSGWGSRAVFGFSVWRYNTVIRPPASPHTVGCIVSGSLHPFALRSWVYPLTSSSPFLGPWSVLAPRGHAVQAARRGRILHAIDKPHQPPTRPA